MTEAIKVAKNSFDAKNYYSATIRLAEAYLRLNQAAVVEKSIFMLESIFPKVLIMKSKHLESDLYLTYAKTLDAHCMFRKFAQKTAYKNRQTANLISSRNWTCDS